MSVDLQFFGNHNLSFETYESGLREVEQAMKISITKLNTWEPNPEERDNYEKIIYKSFYSYNNGIIDDRLICLKINFDQCGFLRIFKNGFDITEIKKITPRFHAWKKLVSKDFLKNQEDRKYLEWWNTQYADWIKLKTFTVYVLRHLGGNKLVYINDLYFQDFGPELQFGMAFQEALAINEKISSPLDYNILLETGEPYLDYKDWYLEQFDFNNADSS